MTANGNERCGAGGCAGKRGGPTGTGGSRRGVAYAAALAYLHGLTDWERRTMDRSAREQLPLERPAALLERLGHPERRYRTVLVAGTNGKGSTAAMLAGILRAAGYRTGFYSQPHLHTFRERIRVDAAMIAEDEVVAGLGRIQPHAEALHRDRPHLGACTAYEVSTALALDHFARAEVQVAVLEVGLGGRLDATNVVEADLAVITSLSLDHTAVLGDTLPEIAAEKAAIAKPGRPLLTSPQQADALEVVVRAAAERAAPLGIAGRDWAQSGDHAAFSVDAPAARDGLWPTPWHHKALTVPLLGAHQLENAATAVAAARVLTAGASPHGRGAFGPAVARGLAATRWPARFEVLRPPLVHRADGGGAGPVVVVDGAHNPDAAARLAAALRAHAPHERLWLVVGVSEDKDLAGICDPLARLAAGGWAVASRHPRSRPAAEVAEALCGAGLVAQAVRAAAGTGSGLAAALAAAGPRDAVCVTGSLFVAAEAREALGLVSPDQRDPEGREE